MKNFFNKLKNVKARQAVYPLIIVVFTAIVVVLFAYSARFLSAELNQALSVDEKSIDATLTRIDLAGYAVVGKKLGIVIQEAANAPPPPAPAETSVPGAASSTSPNATSTQSIKIQILNSTKDAGAATRLSALLKKNGFSDIATGIQSKEEKTTLIKIKLGEENTAVIGQLSAVMAVTKYKAVTSTIDEANPYGVVIVIGLQ